MRVEMRTQDWEKGQGAEGKAFHLFVNKRKTVFQQGGQKGKRHLVFNPCIK